VRRRPGGKLGLDQLDANAHVLEFC
jgi:hypothetical protein